MTSRPDLKVYTGEKIDRDNGVARRIEQDMSDSGGRVPFSAFMKAALDGYYVHGSPSINAGVANDFSTCTKVEAFNVTIGNSARKVWETMGKPAHFDILEQGAGTGMMAKDILTWAQKSHPDFFDSLRYTIVEPGNLIKQQQLTIGEDNGSSPRKRELDTEQNAQHLQKVRWIQGSALQLPMKDNALNGIALSNELPDAFPVEIVKNIDDTLYQKYVTIDNDEWVEIWDELSQPVQTHVNKHGIKLKNHGEEPINLNAVHYMAEIDRVLNAGATLTVDYGYEGPLDVRNDKFRAIRTYPLVTGTWEDFQKGPNNCLLGEQTDGQSITILRLFTEYRRNLGRLDVTSDVDFRALRRTAEDLGHTTTSSGPQIDFLNRFGLAKFMTAIGTENTDHPSHSEAVVRFRYKKHMEILSHPSFRALMTHVNIDRPRLSRD